MCAFKRLVDFNCPFYVICVFHVNSHSLSIYSIKEQKIFVYLGLFFYISELRHSTDHADNLGLDPLVWANITCQTSTDNAY